jgi:uncharacterized protein (DUF779 family)
MTERVSASNSAKVLIAQLKEKHGDLMFHQSGGCCDGSQPMCFQKGEFRTGSSDVCIGCVEGVEFWMSRDQFEYWQHTHLTLDTTPGRGSSFSLEIPLGIRFIIRSRMFTEEEIMHLSPLI